jgi:hypothetical protein
MQISIPVPCAENWDGMSPTEKGAFCQKCNHEVIDFTKKSPEEIRETLFQRSTARTCGLISPLQMELVNTGFHVWDNQPVKVFRSKFIYACVLVFGLSLFTGCESKAEPGQEKNPVETTQFLETDQDSMHLAVPGMMEQSDSICLKPGDTLNTGEYSLSTDLKGRISCE